MRKLLQAALVAAATVLPQLALAAKAAAPLPPLEPNQIRITAVVPDRRIIVADANGNIEHFYSNTAKNVVPEVMAGAMGGEALPLSPQLRRQYEAIMAQLHERKVVSVAAASNQNRLGYPSFLGKAGTQEYSVQPSRSGNEPPSAPYVITVY